MTRDVMLRSLKDVQPTAYNVRLAGRCHCRQGELLFYHLPEYGEQRDENRVSGGYYCPACGFGNAGAMRIDDYEQAERIDDV